MHRVPYCHILKLLVPAMLDRKCRKHIHKCRKLHGNGINAVRSIPIPQFITILLEAETNHQAILLGTIGNEYLIKS